MDLGSAVTGNKKLPRKPKLSSARVRPARLDPIVPVTVESGNLAPGQMADDSIPMTAIRLEKRMISRQATSRPAPLPREIMLSESAALPEVLRRSVTPEGSAGGVSCSSTMDSRCDTRDPTLSLSADDDQWVGFHGFSALHSNPTESSTFGGSDHATPQPRSGEEGHGFLRGDVLTESLLKNWLGCEDLKQLRTAELRIDVNSLFGVDQLRPFMPQLRCLRLTGSNIGTVRSLGTRFHSLKILWLNNCRLNDLRGIGALAPQLAELYMAFNNITDLNPLLALSETLEVLDTEGNRVSDLSSLKFVLQSLSRLHTLTLQGNAVEDSEELQAFVEEEEREAAGDEPLSCPQASNDLGDVFGSKNPQLLFRKWVKMLMPRLKYLDDIPLLTDAEDVGNQANEASGQMVRQDSLASATLKMEQGTDAALKDELRLVQECLRDLGFDTLQESIQGCSQSRWSSHSGRPSQSSRHSTSTRVSSSLTTGGALTGSAISSLRKRLHKVVQEEDVTVGEHHPPHLSSSAMAAKPPSAEPISFESFNWDEEEDEWEKLKANLRRSKLSQQVASGENPKTVEVPRYRLRYNELKKRQKEGTATNTTASTSTDDPATSKGHKTNDDTPEPLVVNGWVQCESEEDNDDFDAFLKHEVTRTRAHIAREGSSAVPGEAAADFIANQNCFEVITLD